MTRFRYLLALVLALSPVSASAQWRVVVQEADCKQKEVSEDGSLVACTAGAQGHVLQVIDFKSARVVFAHAFPEMVHAAAFTSDRKTMAVSTIAGIFRASLADGRVEEILPGVAGLVAFDSAGKRLGVLGSLPSSDLKPGKPLSHFGQKTTLGVYDLQGKRWVHQVDTAIVEGKRVVFAGETLIGYGRCGNLHSMIPTWYYSDVQLDATSGKARTRTSGYYLYRDQKGKDISGEKPGPKHPDHKDPNYQPPKAVAESLARAEQLLKNKDWQAIQQRLSATLGYTRGEAHFAAAPSRDRILFGVQRTLPEPRPVARTAAVEITRDGSLRMHPSLASLAELGQAGDLLIGIDRSEQEARAFDVTTGKTGFPLTLAQKAKRKKGRQREKPGPAFLARGAAGTQRRYPRPVQTGASRAGLGARAAAGPQLARVHHRRPGPPGGPPPRLQHGTGCAGPHVGRQDRRQRPPNGVERPVPHPGGAGPGRQAPGRSL